MKKNILVILLLRFCSFNGVLADQVSCEKIESRYWDLGNWKTCYMDKTTAIHSTETTITSRDETIEGLWFYYNKKINLLPIKINETFPNLKGLGAYACSLATISKANFKGLNKLRGLYLGHNQIEKIPRDVFDDLVAVEILWLSNNKIKFINGQTFARLSKLRHVYLMSNQCINENFVTASRIAELQSTVNEKCSFSELEDNVKNTFSIDKKCGQAQDFTKFANITLEGIKAGTSKLINKLNELETQQKVECGNIAKILEAQTKTCKDQQIYFNEALENKTAEIINVKVKSEMQTMLKMTQIQRLEEQLQKKNAEVIEKNEKIKKLEDKVESLSGTA